MIERPLHRHLISGLLAAAIGAGGGFVAVKKWAPSTVVVHGAKRAPTNAVWGEMSQAEVDALTAELKKLAPRPVAIFCRDTNCDDLALDFDNALESAHWPSGIERPITDTNTGLNVAPDSPGGRELAGAIERATGGRLKPGMIAADIGDRLAIIISPKK